MTPLQQEIRDACLEDDPDRLRAALATSADPRAELLSLHAVHNVMELCIKQNAHKVIPLLTYHVPEWLKEINEDKETYFLHAAQQLKTDSMLALARAGSDLQYHHPLDSSWNAMGYALMNSINAVAPRHLLALRELGFDINMRNERDIPCTNIHCHNGETPNRLQSCLSAGADFYLACDILSPAGVFNPHYFHFRTNELISCAKPIIDKAPNTRKSMLSSKTFLNSGEMRPEVLQWESLRLLPHYFTPETARFWNHGIAEMTETAARLPSYLQHHFNIAGAQREDYIAHDRSVLVDYVRGGGSRER